MKAKIKVALNKRGAPSVNASKDRHYVPGQEIEVVEIVNGDLVDGIDVWYKLDNGSYVWSGGVGGYSAMSPPEMPMVDRDLSKSMDWWHSKFDIPKLWDQYKTRGADVVIAILDSGIARNHTYFDYSKIHGVNVYDKRQDYVDTYGHGTAVASIVGSNGEELIGIAPDAHLFIEKIYPHGRVDPEVLLEAFNLIPNEVDIVIVSQALLPQDVDQTVAKDIEKIVNADKFVCVAACGNNSNQQLPYDIDNIPSSIKKVISTTAIDSENTIFPQATKSTTIDLSAPGVNMKTLNPRTSDVQITSGTSYAAPFIAGVGALVLSYSRNNMDGIKPLNLNELRSLLINSFDAISSQSKSIYGKGLINPTKAFSLLINQNKKI